MSVTTIHVGQYFFENGQIYQIVGKKGAKYETSRLSSCCSKLP